MSVDIESVTIDTVADKRLKLTNAQWAAKLDIGNDWDRLRVGARISVTDTGANLVGTPRFWFGVCSDPSAGFANGPLSGASCKHFAGIRTIAGTWNRVTGSPRNYYNDSTNAVGIVNVLGSVLTAAPSSVNYMWGVNETTHRHVYIVEINKTAGTTLTIAHAIAQSSLSQADISQAELVNAMEIDNGNLTGAVSYLNTLTNASYQAGTPSATIALDEATNGSLNSICCAWDRSSPAMWFSEMFFAKMA